MNFRLTSKCSPLLQKGVSVSSTVESRTVYPYCVTVLTHLYTRTSLLNYTGTVLYNTRVYEYNIRAEIQWSDEYCISGEHCWAASSVSENETDMTLKPRLKVRVKGADEPERPDLALEEDSLHVNSAASHARRSNFTSYCSTARAALLELDQQHGTHAPYHRTHAHECRALADLCNLK